MVNLPAPPPGAGWRHLPWHRAEAASFGATGALGTPSVPRDVPPPALSIAGEMTPAACCCIAASESCPGSCRGCSGGWLCSGGAGAPRGGGQLRQDPLRRPQMVPWERRCSGVGRQAQPGGSSAQSTAGRSPGRRGLFSRICQIIHVLFQRGVGGPSLLSFASRRCCGPGSRAGVVRHHSSSAALSRSLAPGRHAAKTPRRYPSMAFAWQEGDWLFIFIFFPLKEVAYPWVSAWS